MPTLLPDASTSSTLLLSFTWFRSSSSQCVTCAYSMRCRCDSKALSELETVFGKPGRRFDSFSSRTSSVEHDMLPTNSPTFDRAKKKTLMMAFAIVTAFALLGAPYCIIEMILCFNASIISDLSKAVFAVISIGNSVLNPFIYLIFDVHWTCELRSSRWRDFSPKTSFLMTEAFSEKRKSAKPGSQL